VGQVFLDDQTEVPEFATVRTGMFGTKESFVPLAQAQTAGDDISVPYDKDTIKGAPNIDAETRLSQEEEAQLYSYYGLTYSETRSGSGLPTETAGAGMSASPAGGQLRDDAEHAARGDASGRPADEAMTRSEERLRVGTERVERGRARLRKYVTTEQVQQTVPVTREEVRVEREPITEANVDEAMRGPEISEAEHEVTLTEERPVVEKETVPVERVRLTKEPVTEEAEVSEPVAKERVETEGVEGGSPDEAGRRRGKGRGR
jgi:uncharacterized protein (TIGR02271 family)